MSSSPSTDRQYHHGNLRQALLDAAVELLVTTPASELSLREIARVAQVSHAAPYHYFTNRQGLVRAAGVEAMRRLLRQQENAVKRAATARERLLAMGKAYVRFAAREPNAFELVFDAKYCRPDAPAEDMTPLIAANQHLLTLCVVDAQGEGVLPPGDPAPIATALWGTVHGLAQLVISGHIPFAQAESGLGAMLPTSTVA